MNIYEIHALEVLENLMSAQTLSGWAEKHREIINVLRPNILLTGNRLIKLLS